MKEVYYLDQDTLPVMPTPHDCVIEHIRIENDCIVFEFEDDINKRDANVPLRPGARSLVIRYHLVYEDGFAIFKGIKPGKIFFREGGYKRLSENAMITLAESKLEYLYHYVSYNSVIIHMWSGGDMILYANVDYVEYEWIDVTSRFGI